MDINKKKELLKFLDILETRKREYGIIDTRLQKHQSQLIDSAKEMVEIDGFRVPKYKYILYQGGNGSGKTFTGLYLTVLLALGDLTSIYGLPYIGSRKDIWIVTKSSSNVSTTIGPYLVGEFSKARIPPDAISKIIQDNGIIKEIILKNKTKISIRTYDQGHERLQGGTPDFLLVDEEPLNKLVWEEILARGRDFKCQIVITMTPLHGLTPVYSYFYEQNSKDVNDRIKKFLVSSLDNKFADHTGLMGLTEQDKLMRIYGQFVPPSGLVYPNFNRGKNVVEHFNPKELGYGTKYYGAIDFGVVHPTAFLLISVDVDGNIYIFDYIYESGLLISQISEGIKKKIREYDIELEYITADTAAKRERTELNKLGIKTVPADKWSKGENGESNRKAGIMKLNQLLFEGKIFISDKLKGLIQEFEIHHYKDGGKKDGEVEKTNDDLLDALRYWIFSYKVPKYKTKSQIKFEEKYGVNHNKNNYYEQLYNNPY